MASKTALITGGAGGIGSAITTALADCKIRIVVLDVDLDGARRVAAGVEEKGIEALAVQADITKFEQIQNAVEQALTRFESIDILVNNAGWTEAHPFLEESEAYWDRVIDINLKGVMLMSHAVLPNMIESKQGRIVNVASEAGRVGAPYQAAYSAAKGGVIAFTKALALENARHNIFINCVCPGQINTPLLHNQPEHLIKKVTQNIPMRRVGEPEEIADAVAFLCSEKASYITGQALSVGGGITMAD